MALSSIVDRFHALHEVIKENNASDKESIDKEIDTLCAVIGKEEEEKNRKRVRSY